METRLCQDGVAKMLDLVSGGYRACVDDGFVDGSRIVMSKARRMSGVQYMRISWR